MESCIVCHTSPPVMCPPPANGAYKWGILWYWTLHSMHTPFSRARWWSQRDDVYSVPYSVPQSGRETLENAIRMVEADPEWNAHVAYGDTDSLFVHLPGRCDQGLGCKAPNINCGYPVFADVRVIRCRGALLSTLHDLGHRHAIVASASFKLASYKVRPIIFNSFVSEPGDRRTY